MPTSALPLAIIFGVLAVAAVLGILAEVRKRADAIEAKAGRDSIKQDMRELSTTVRAIAFHHAQDPALRTHLIASLAEANVLCAHCPLRNSDLCHDCGRFASGEGRAKA